MTNLSMFMPQAEEIAGIIDNLMIDELGLMAPAAYELKMREKRIYLVGHYDPLMMGRSLRAYENPEIARRLQNAIGKPVHINKHTGTRYVVLMQGSLSLPRSAKFPFNQRYERDIFRLGIGAKGEITLSAREMLNVMIGAAQGSGKSTILDLLTYQMLVFGWRLYLADPQQHTFSPGLWNDRIAMPVAGSHADMIKVLNAIESELATRVHLFQQAAQGGRPPKDIDAYNALGIEPLPRIGFVSDESNFYLENKAIFHRFAEILREGRKFGLHIVVAAHEWHKDTIKSGVNDLFQTRIALNSLSGSVVLRNHQWGKWVEGRAPGRGVLKTNKFEPIQFYLLEEARQETKLPSEICPIPDHELQLIKRAINTTEGRMTISILTGWGMSEPSARELTTRYDANGWLEKDPNKGNARFVTQSLKALLEKFAPNHQTVQTHQTSLDCHQTGSEPLQTALSDVQISLTSQNVG
jgi:hypothetical protein